VSGRDDSRYAAKGAGFARAVRADQAENFTRRRRKRQLGDRSQVSINLAEIIDLQDGGRVCEHRGTLAKRANGAYLESVTTLLELGEE
jgi:hypothetical protein